MHLPPLEVGILKPREVSRIDRESAQVICDAGGNDHRHADQRVCHFLIAQLREMIGEVADALSMKVCIKDYATYYNSDEQLVVDFGSAAELCQDGMTVVVDPPDKELSFAATITTNPLRRLLAAFSKNEGFEERFDVLGSLKLPLATADDEHFIDLLPKAFGLHIPAYADDAANRYKKNCEVVALALTYPYGLAVKKERKKYFEFN